MDFPFMHVEDFGEAHEFRSLNGRVRVRFRWEPPHEIGGVSPVSLVWPRGASFPVARTTNPVSQGFQINAVTVGDDTAVLARLLAENPVVGVVHTPWVCQIRECQIPEFQIVHVTAFPREMTGHVVTQTYRWALDCTPADPGLVGPVHEWMWGDVDDRWETWAGVETAHGTWAGVEDDR